MKKNKTEVHSLDDIDITLLEVCDVDSIYQVTIGDMTYDVSIRATAEMKEGDVVLLDDDNDTLIGFVSISKSNMKKQLKSIFLAWLVGKGKICVKSDKW